MIFSNIRKVVYKMIENSLETNEGESYVKFLSIDSSEAMDTRIGIDFSMSSEIVSDTFNSFFHLEIFYNNETEKFEYSFEKASSNLKEGNKTKGKFSFYYKTDETTTDFFIKFTFSSNATSKSEDIETINKIDNISTKTEVFYGLLKDIELEGKESLPVGAISLGVVDFLTENNKKALQAAVITDASDQSEYLISGYKEDEFSNSKSENSIPSANERVTLKAETSTYLNLKGENKEKTCSLVFNPTEKTLQVVFDSSEE